MKTVIEHMRSLCPISDETVEELMKYFPKRYQLIQENRFCKYAYFIEKGMTRSFWLVDGEEITTSFSCEGGIVFSMDELYYQKKSEEFVETLEEVEAYRIALTDLIRLFETSERVPASAPQPQGAVDSSGQRAVRRIPETVPLCLSTDQSRIYCFVPGNNAFYLESYSFRFRQQQLTDAILPFSLSGTGRCTRRHIVLLLPVYRL